ncbi:MAG: hypothetical protein CMJ30_07580 [Phycisphaerae bacterium]|nr:hypothetical protein [Phycisphaerae bacterium]
MGTRRTDGKGADSSAPFLRLTPIHPPPQLFAQNIQRFCAEKSAICKISDQTGSHKEVQANPTNLGNSGRERKIHLGPP